MITVPDNCQGNVISFSSADSTGATGFTLQLWLYLEPNTSSGTNFAQEFNSLSYGLVPYSTAQPRVRKFAQGWMMWNTDPVAHYGTQMVYYPASSESFGGITPIPEGKWFSIAVTYDQSLKCIRNWVNDGLDHIRYLSRPPSPARNRLWSSSLLWSRPHDEAAI